jgi:hypothetical protein
MGMLTPYKNPNKGVLPDWQKDFNTQIKKIPYVIDQVIANSSRRRPALLPAAE